MPRLAGWSAPKSRFSLAVLQSAWVAKRPMRVMENFIVQDCMGKSLLKVLLTSVLMSECCVSKPSQESRKALYVLISLYCKITRGITSSDSSSQ